MTCNAGHMHLSGMLPSSHAARTYVIGFELPAALPVRGLISSGLSLLGTPGRGKVPCSVGFGPPPCALPPVLSASTCDEP